MNILFKNTNHPLGRPPSIMQLVEVIKKAALFLACTCIAFIFINCKAKPKHMDEFEWDASDCAPKLYPVETYKAYFVFENGYAMDIPADAFLANGWGEEGGTVAGGSFKPLPVRVNLIWISYTENKFYKGSFPLPKDTMAKLFREGFTESFWKRHVTYNVINVGMAPGGVVVVWLKGDGKATEIARFQAKETKISMHDFAPTALQDTQEVYVKSVLKNDDKINENIKNNGIPFGLWDTYREKFNWRTLVDFEDKQNGIVDEIQEYFFNGETDAISQDRLHRNSFEQKSRIKKINFHWSNKRKIKEADIILNEEEIFKAYRFVYQDNQTQQGQFRIHVNKDDSYIWIFLENTDLKNHREVQLHKADIKIYPVDELDRSYYTVFKNEFKDEKN